MDLKQILGIAINVLTVLAARTTSTVDDKLLTLLVALRDSPQLIDWLQSLLVAMGTKPGGAMPLVDFQDEELTAAFKASPLVMQWSLPPQNGSAEQIGLPDLVKFIQYVPVLIELFKAIKNGHLGTVK